MAYTPVNTAGTLRAYFISLYFNRTVISEVFLQNSNQPSGTPDLTGVIVVEVSGDYVVFAQSGSAGATRYIVNLDRILLIDL